MTYRFILAKALLWIVPLAFLLGSIPFGLIVSVVFFKRDIRGAGSGNIGAANALRTLGRKAGVAVLVLDALKGVAAVLLAAFSDKPTLVAPLAGLAAVLGHCYTPWLRLRGGKGVATFLGATAALSWVSGLAFAVVWLGIVASTGMSSVGSIAGVIAAGVVVVLLAPHASLFVVTSAGGRPLWSVESTWVFTLGAVLVVLWKHGDNLARLRAGTENRLELLKR